MVGACNARATMWRLRTLREACELSSDKGTPTFVTMFTTVHDNGHLLPYRAALCQWRPLLSSFFSFLSPSLEIHTGHLKSHGCPLIY
jgi:hypothetical protein